MVSRKAFGVVVLAGITVLAGGCAELPDRLDNFADASRAFAIAHPVLTETALFSARAALRKPQHLALVCQPRCQLATGSGSGSVKAPNRLNLNRNQ
jgi:hypothetical protein